MLLLLAFQMCGCMYVHLQAGLESALGCLALSGSGLPSSRFPPVPITLPITRYGDVWCAGLIAGAELSATLPLCLAAVPYSRAAELNLFIERQWARARWPRSSQEMSASAGLLPFLDFMLATGSSLSRACRAAALRILTAGSKSGSWHVFANAELTSSGRLDFCPDSSMGVCPLSDSNG